MVFKWELKMLIIMRDHGQIRISQKTLLGVTKHRYLQSVRKRLSADNSI